VRRQLIGVVLVALVATSCNVLLTPDPPGPRSSNGFVAAPWWRDRQNSYLEYASSEFSPSSYLNVINNAEWARRSNHRFDVSQITVDDYAE
jgi:hypothetical protein